MHMAYACASVSGSVSLELLAAQTPSVIIFQTSPLMSIAARMLKNTPYITLVNLLAKKELFPERFGYYCSSKWVCDQLSEWVKFPEKRLALVQALGALKASIISAGASKKGAIEIINFIENKKAQEATAA